MLKQIKTTKDVVAFARQLIKEDVSFHPDDDFRNYINIETNEPTYSAEEAGLRNELMSQCFAVCENAGIDIYDTMSEVVLKETGLDRFLPLPSAASCE
ncbi:MAG: hypothetical protein ABI729_02935 [Chitinophagales bacterium]